MSDKQQTTNWPRYFTNATGFPDQTVLIRCESETRTVIVVKGGMEIVSRSTDWFQSAQKFVANGAWVELAPDHANGMIERSKLVQPAHIDSTVAKLQASLLECRNRLAAHDGCSRFQIGDSCIIHRADEALAITTQPEKETCKSAT